jgi:hypothetical protein
MTKEKTALVIPNAIQICTKGEKLFFCSFATRPVAPHEVEIFQD